MFDSLLQTILPLYDLQLVVLGSGLDISDDMQLSSLAYASWKS